MNIALSMVAIISFVVAVFSLIHAVVIRRNTKNETQASMNFIKELIINAAPDPKTVSRLLDDYNKSGEWRTNVFLGEDGKYHLNTTITPGPAILSRKGNPSRSSRIKKTNS